MTNARPIMLIPNEFSAHIEPIGDTVHLVFREWHRFPSEVPEDVIVTIMNKTIAVMRNTPGWTNVNCSKVDSDRWCIKATYDGKRSTALGAIFGEIMTQYAAETSWETAQQLAVLMAATSTGYDAITMEKLIKKIKRYSGMALVAFRRFPRSLRPVLLVLGMPLYVIYRLRGGKQYRHLIAWLEQAMVETT